VETFINQPVHPGTDNIPIPQYVAALARGAQLPKGTPPTQIAASLDTRADAALATLPSFERLALARNNTEFAGTIADIRAMALLGKYYAAKIRGATELALFRATRAPQHQVAAVDELTRAAGFWSDYTTGAAAHYRNPLWTNRVGIVDWHELDAEVANDISIARAPLH
jgi:hypothetical protein